jgi:hypothetical protein
MPCKNVHRITCHPVAAENQQCRQNLHLLPAHERKNPQQPPASHKPVSDPGFPRSQREASRNRRPLHSAFRSRPHTSATRETGSAIFTGRQKRGAPRSSSRGAWWAPPSALAKHSFSLYTPLPPGLLAASHSRTPLDPFETNLSSDLTALLPRPSPWVNHLFLVL